MIKLSNDSKTRCYKAQKNALGLMPGPENCGGTCPYSTTGEGGCWSIPEGRKLNTCYVAHCIARRPNVKALLQHNTGLMKTTTKTQLLVETFDAFRKKELKRPDPQLNFRLHWSGDIFNIDYAKALVESMSQFPDINFWTYTRSFPYVSLFEKATNLSLYLSLDKQNLNQGLQTYCQFKWPHLKLCYLSPVEDWKEQFKDVKDLGAIKFTACPVDSGKLELEHSCIKCKMCLYNDKKIHIWFKTK